MRYRKLFASLLISVSLLQIAQPTVFAESEESPIVIDGNFSDWEKMLSISDRKGDVPNGKNHEDIIEVKYYSDGEYLYLHVERQSAGHHQEGWTFHVVFPDATKGYDKEEYINVDGTCKNIKYRYPIIQVQGRYHQPSGNMKPAVTVTAEDESGGGDYQETTFSVDNNKKEAEFRVPLKLFGLEKSKELRFALKSNLSGQVCPATNTIDWVPDSDWIYIDNGPTLWQFSAIAGFGIVGFAAYRILRRK